MNRSFEKMIGNIKKIKSVKGKDRLEYLWMYYKHWIVIVLFGILLIQTVYTMICNSREEHILTVVLVDTNIEKLQEVKSLEYDLESFLCGDKKHQVVMIDTSAYSRETDENIAKLAVALSIVSDTDAVICDRTVYDRYCKENIFMNWKDILGDSYKKYEEYIEDGMINLALSKRWTEREYTKAEESYLCVLNKSMHVDNVRRMLDYLLFGDKKYE